MWKEQPPWSSPRPQISNPRRNSSQRCPSMWGTCQQHCLIPWAWLRSAASPLHAEHIRSRKIKTYWGSRSITCGSLEGKGLDPNCMEKYILHIPARHPPTHPVSCRCDQHPPHGIPLSRRIMACSFFSCVPVPALLSAKVGWKKFLHLKQNGVACDTWLRSYMARCTKLSWPLENHS